MSLLVLKTLIIFSFNIGQAASQQLGSTEVLDSVRYILALLHDQPIDPDIPVKNNCILNVL